MYVSVNKKMKKTSENSYVVRSKDPIRTSDASSENDIRPPPKIFQSFRETKGLSPKKVKKMISNKKEYEIELEKIQNERDLIEFEARLNPINKKSENVPSIPLAPKIDEDLIKYYDPPSATRFYDYPIPKKPCSTRKKSAIKKVMSRGCPACNPEHFESIRPFTATDKRECICCNHEHLPYMIGQSYWNVLDEVSVPSRPKTQMRDHPKPVKFSITRTGPRPAGIPIVLDDLAETRRVANERFEIEMQKKLEKETQKKESIVRKHSEQCRNAIQTRQDKTRTLSALSGQQWVNYHRLSALDNQTVEEKDRTYTANIYDQEAMKELQKYDDELYLERKKKKQSKDLLGQFLDQNQIL